MPRVALLPPGGERHLHVEPRGEGNATADHHCSGERRPLAPANWPGADPNHGYLIREKKG
jgi:hypothetical protein